MLQEPDLATAAALIGEPTRAVILSALLSGEALPASELAYRAQVTPQTASSHLNKLLDGGLIAVTTMGRHRYYSLKSPQVAQTLEALQVIAPSAKPKLPRAAKISPELCSARTCYDHLAGKLGVAFTDALLQSGYLILNEQRYAVTAAGLDWLTTLQVDVAALKKERRKFAYACLDWSERRFHLAGSLGAVITNRFFERGWIKRLPHTRAVQLTPAGDKMLKQTFGIALDT